MASAGNSLRLRNNTTTARTNQHKAKVTKNQSKYVIAENSIINVGGKTFPILNALDWRTIPLKRFQALKQTKTVVDVLKNCDCYDSNKDEIFFDRCPEAFECIIQCCLKRRTIHIAKSICPLRMLDELNFWGVDVGFLDLCCKDKLESVQGYVKDIGHMVEEYRIIANKQDKTENLESLTFQERVHITLNHPSSSLFAKIWTLFDTIVIVVSLAIFTLLTVFEDKEDKHHKQQKIMEKQDLAENLMKCMMCTKCDPSEITPVSNNSTLTTLPKNSILCTDNPEVYYLELIEMCCIIWFTFEFCSRAAFCPSKRAFFKQTINWIDVLSIMPFYLHMLVTLSMKHFSEEGAQAAHAFQKMLSVFRILRVIRVLKLGKHSDGLKLLGQTMSRSAEHLSLLQRVEKKRKQKIES